MRVDMHAHVVPESFPDALGSAGADSWPRMDPGDSADERVLVFGKVRLTAKEVWFRAERRVTAMDANGIDAEVVSPLPPLLNYELPPQRGRDLCGWINDFVGGLCAATPGRIYGLGTVPLQDPELAAGELSTIRDRGLSGIEIGSNVGGVSLGDERFVGFFQEAERLGIPIFVHAATPTVGDRLAATAMPTFGFADEISVSAASVVTSGLADKCPNLRLCFSHGAGGFPLMLTRAQYFWSGAWNEEPSTEERAADPTRAQYAPVEYARRYYYDALVFDHRALRYLIDMIGSRRLVLGTDFPAMPRQQPADRTLRSMSLSAEVLDDVTWNNCFRFLGVSPFDVL